VFANRSQYAKARLSLHQRCSTCKQTAIASLGNLSEDPSCSLAELAASGDWPTDEPVAGRLQHIIYSKQNQRRPPAAWSASATDLVMIYLCSSTYRMPACSIDEHELYQIGVLTQVPDMKAYRPFHRTRTGGGKLPIHSSSCTKYVKLGLPCCHPFDPSLAYALAWTTVVTLHLCPSMENENSQIEVIQGKDRRLNTIIYPVVG
jgi:hypothetical protein